jgi:hypothetical protein
MVKEKKPLLVFLMETKMNNKKIEFLRAKLKFDNMFVVESVGRSGGLAMLWSDGKGKETPFGLFNGDQNE